MPLWIIHKRKIILRSQLFLVGSFIQLYYNMGVNKKKEVCMDLIDLYSGYEQDKIVASGIFTLTGYKNKIHWFIRTRGYFPTAYVEYIGENKDLSLNGLDDSLHNKVHGGITYFDVGVPGHRTEDFEGGLACYVGWDYAHDGDYVGFLFLNRKDAKKWSLEEVKSEVFDECEAMIKLYGEKIEEPPSIGIKSTLTEEDIKGFMRELDSFLLSKINLLIEKVKESSQSNKEQEVKESIVPEGTSCLVRLEGKGEIFIANRGKKKTSYKNCLLISNDIRERFFEDLRYYKVNKKGKKYSILKEEDPDLYNAYSLFMDEQYRKQKGE
jgi:hypothetical protein